MSTFATFEGFEAIKAAAADGANTKKFVGNGTPFLEVPGLVTVKAVRIGDVEIPLIETRKHPTDSTLTNFVEVEEKIIDLQTNPDGVKTLLRSILSNNGIWQAGASIFVTGDWEGEKAKKSPTPPATPPQEPAQ
jgi:hypothetical protein